MGNLQAVTGTAASSVALPGTGIIAGGMGLGLVLNTEISLTMGISPSEENMDRADDLYDGAQKGNGDLYSYKNGKYEKADYHSGQTTGKKNPAPKDGQFALDNSVSIGENTTRRVGIDSNGDFVVFDETASGTFHGHVRTWNSSNGNQGLTQAMKNALYDAGYIKSPKGTSFKLTDYAKELIGS